MTARKPVFQELYSFSMDADRAPPLKATVLSLFAMKYRDLNSVAHNFSHSFVSFTNYFEDGHVVDDLLQLARKANGERISIRWIPDSPPLASFPSRVRTSIANYRARLPEHFAKSGADITVVREFRTDIYQKSNKQIAVESHLVDIRGKEHIANVIF